LADRREVRIKIGKRSYSIQTELDDEMLKRVVDIVKEAGGVINGSVDQDNLLMLTCLQLAYNLEKVSELLEIFDRRFNDLKL